MENKTIYQYKANNESSYGTLAYYATSLPVNVSLSPGSLTLNIDGSAAKEVGQFIDDNGLSFHITPIEQDGENIDSLVADERTDASVLREIIRGLDEKIKVQEDMHKESSEAMQRRLQACETNLREARGNAESYREWYAESQAETDRIKRQIQAISLLFRSIFPETRPS